PRPRDRWQSAAELGSALREFRFNMTDAGAPAAELSSLMNRLFPPDAQRAEPRLSGGAEFITINTVAGFRPGDSLGWRGSGVSADRDGEGDERTESGSLPNFDEPTVVADPVARALDADAGSFAKLRVELRPGAGRPGAAPPAGSSSPVAPLPPPPRGASSGVLTPGPEEFVEGAPFHPVD